MNVLRVFRSRNLGYYSIEKVYYSIRSQMAPHINIEEYFVPNKGFSIYNILCLAKHASRRKNFIYHITGDIHYCIFALPRKRSILTIHDCVFIHNTKGVKRFLIKKIFLDWPVKYARVITTISQKTKDEIISLTGCAPSKIFVIGNPVASEIQYIPKQINKQSPILLFIGSTPNKNLDTVIEAVKNFKCSLRILGQPVSKQLQKMKEYRIDYLCESNLSNIEVAELYCGSDIVIFPSLYEGFGLPVIEGFKAGRPVLTSSISPLKELSGDAAWLVDPTNADEINVTLKKILFEDELREEKIQIGLERAKQFSAEKIAKLYSGLYQSICQGGNPK